MKKLFLALVAVVLLSGCRSKVDSGFFVFSGPDGFGECKLTSVITDKIVLSTEPKELTQIGQMTSAKGYMGINWYSGNFRESQATKALGIGTLPDGANKISEGDKTFGGVLGWEETIVQLDSTKKSELRWLYHVVIPLDCGAVEILASIMPNRAMLEDVKNSIASIEITNKKFFGAK